MLRPSVILVLALVLAAYTPHAGAQTGGHRLLVVATDFDDVLWARSLEKLLDGYTVDVA